MKSPILVLGAGGFAREVYNWIDHSVYQVMGFYSQSRKTDELYQLPVFGAIGSEHRYMSYVCAVGDPFDREAMCEEAEKAGMVPALPVVHRSAIVGVGSVIHRGSILCPNVVVTCDATIGRHVILNLGATVGHDTVVGEFSTVSPGANISGNVYIGKRTYIGTNSSIRERVRVGDNAVVAMGAAVVKDVPSDMTVTGVPARELALLAVRP